MTTYDVCREDGDGQLLSFDLHGHGHDLDAIERLLNGEAAEELQWWGEDPHPLGFDVVETWRRVVPRGDWSEYVYCGPGRGAMAVTSVMVVTPTRHWCLNHPDRPAQVGEPATGFIDGQDIAERELARIAHEVDPRRTVDAPTTDSRHPAYSRPAYLWFCGECYRRHAWARDERAREVPRG